MPCKRDKDLTKCVARAKVYIAETKYFWAVYLWEDAEALTACDIEEHHEGQAADAAIGLCCHMPYRIIFNNGQEREVSAPKLGELHFVKDKWTLNIVTHECRHTESTAHRVLGIVPYSIENGQDIEQEERACDYLGRLADSVYSWLWEVNAHGPHTKESTDAD